MTAVARPVLAQAQQLGTHSALVRRRLRGLIDMLSVDETLSFGADRLDYRMKASGAETFAVYTYVQTRKGNERRAVVNIVMHPHIDKETGDLVEITAERRAYAVGRIVDVLAVRGWQRAGVMWNSTDGLMSADEWMGEWET